ncbi:hypothetical protein TWF694_002584 [Orbilia ellipsospora]|uniref:Carboxymuconolactone decarboxylase-like domain-containing protein n=1 Tax=Orbilia ellipsospora TaxID=2528407 RepID=A0AAV9X3J0_9PEZI
MESSTADLETSALIGPWQHFLYLPHSVFAAHIETYKALNEISGFPLRCREVVILAVGEYFGALYMQYCHTRVAKEAGLSDVQIQSILDGMPPSGGSEEEITSWEITRALIRASNTSRKGYLDDGLWEKAEKHFGKIGAGAIIQWISFYAGIAIILNGAAIPVPKGQKIWPIN